MLQLTDKLYKAVESSDVEAVREFMNKGANVNLVSSHGRTALGRAAQLGHLAIVCLLLDAEKFGECPNQTLAIGEANNLRQALFSATSPKSLPVTITASSVPYLGTCKNSFEVLGEDAVAKKIVESSFPRAESLPVSSVVESAGRNSSTTHRSKALSLNSPLMHNHSGSDNSLPDSNLVDFVNHSCSTTVISSQIVSSGPLNGCSSGARPKTNKSNVCNRRSKKLLVQWSSSLSFGEEESSSKECNTFSHQATVRENQMKCGYSSDSEWSDSCENMCSKHSIEYDESFKKGHCQVQKVFTGNLCYLSDSYSDLLGSPCDNIINSSSSEKSESQNDLGPPNYNNNQSCVPFENNISQLASKQITTSENCTNKTDCVDVSSPTVCDITYALSLNNSSNTIVSSSQPLSSSPSVDDSFIPLSNSSHCCDKADSKPKVSPLSSSVLSPKHTSYIPCCSNGSSRQPASAHCSIPVTISSKDSKCSASLQGNKDASKSHPTAVQALACSELLARKLTVATSNALFLASESRMKGSAVSAHSERLASRSSSAKRIPAAASTASLEHIPSIILSKVESQPNAVSSLTGTINCPPAIPCVINKHEPTGKSLLENSHDCNPELITPCPALTPVHSSVKRIPCTNPLTFLVTTTGATRSLSSVTNVTWSLEDSLLGQLENHNCCSQKQMDKSNGALSLELKQGPKNSSLLSNESIDNATVKDFSVNDGSFELFPKSVKHGATIIRNVRRQPNIGYYVMAHDDLAESDRSACRLASQRKPLLNSAHLPASPHPSHSSLDDALLSSETFTMKIERTATCSVAPLLATPTTCSVDLLAAILSSPQMHQGCAAIRANVDISVARDHALVSISEQSTPSSHPSVRSRNTLLSDHLIAGSSARLSQSHTASTASASSSVLGRLPGNALSISPVDPEGSTLRASTRHHHASNSDNNSSASGQSPLSSDSDDSRLWLKRKRLRHSKRDLLHQASSALLPLPLSFANNSQSPHPTRGRSVTSKLPDHKAKGCGGLLIQKKQKKHKKTDCMNNHAGQEQVERQDNCSSLESAEVKDHKSCGNERFEFPGSSQDVTEDVNDQADAAMGGGWSVAQWYNSRWGAELRAQYQSVGAAWPWALASACDCDVVDRHGSTALHYAAHAGHDHIVAVLLNAGASVDRTDGEELTALHLATERGASTVVDTLLKRGASVNSRGPNKSTALHMAASRGHTALADKLISHGGRLNSLDTWERTPLMAAASRGDVDTTRLLVQRGAALNVHDIHGYTALCEAVWLESEPLVRLLLEAGGTASQSQHLLHYAVQHRNLPLTRLLLHHGWVVNLKDDAGAMPLMIAARTSSPETMELLLQHGANPNARHWVTGCSALHCAVEGTRDEQHDQFTELFRLLVAAGVHLSVSAQLDGDTPLYRALLLQKIRAAELLIRHGASLQCGTPVLGLELLRVAVYGNNRRLALLLVLAGCPLHPCRWLDAGPFPPGSLHHTIARLRANPFRLFDLSRIAVRRLLGERLVQTAPLLPLPTLLQRALLIVGDEEASGEE